MDPLANQHSWLPEERRYMAAMADLGEGRYPLEAACR
jgi:hypothetical protein